MSETTWRGQDGRIAVRGLVALVAAVGGNLLTLEFGGAAARLPPLYHPGAVGTVAVPVLATVAATALFSHLDRTRPRPYRSFVRAVFAGLLVSAIPIVGAAVAFSLGLAEVSILTASHLAVATCLLLAFLPLERASGD